MTHRSRGARAWPVDSGRRARRAVVSHYRGPAGATHAAVLGVAAVSAAVTVAAAVVPRLRSGDRLVAAHVALETAASLIALLAGFLVAGRLWRRARLDELVLACGLAVLAVTNLVFVTVPALTGGWTDELTGWATMVGLPLGSVLFAFAAFAPRRRLRRAGPAIAVGVAGVAGVVLLSGVVVRIVDVRVTGVFVAAGGQVPRAGPDPGAYPALAAAELTVAVLYAVAAVGFLTRSRQHHDEFLGWIANAVVLAAASYVNYFLYPPVYMSRVSVGDAFRLAFYLVLLIGSMREIRSYWQALSDAAVLAERQRIARDLHDGLAQELAYLSRHLDGADGPITGEALERLRGAALRAQIESRRAVRTLAASGERPFPTALAEAVGDVADRLGVTLELDLVGDVQPTPTRAEAITRVACEAVANAARHSGTNVVRLSLERDGQRLRLRIVDHGRGFDATRPGRGFGLVSMRERARSAGGDLWIISAPGRGSEVVMTV